MNLCLFCGKPNRCYNKAYRYKDSYIVNPVEFWVCCNSNCPFFIQINMSIAIIPSSFEPDFFWRLNNLSDLNEKAFAKYV